jgi:hypothetical protein
MCKKKRIKERRTETNNAERHQRDWRKWSEKGKAEIKKIHKSKHRKLINTENDRREGGGK